MVSLIRNSGEAHVVSQIRLDRKFCLVFKSQLKVMVRYTLEEKIEICEIYHRTRSVILTQREFRQKFGKKPPSKPMILYQQTKFRETGSVTRRQYERARPVLTETKMDEILEFFLINPKTSLYRAAQQLQISEPSLRRAVRKELKFCPYKIQILEAKQPGDKEKRLEFALETLALIHLDDSVLSSLWISDEAYFCLSGKVNKQNMRKCTRMDQTACKICDETLSRKFEEFLAKRGRKSWETSSGVFKNAFACKAAILNTSCNFRTC
jgi:AraC-like DNA-binding protein